MDSTNEISVEYGSAYKVKDVFCYFWNKRKESNKEETLQERELRCHVLTFMADGFHFRMTGCHLFEESPIATPDGPRFQSVLDFLADQK